MGGSGDKKPLIETATTSTTTIDQSNLAKVGIEEKIIDQQ